MAGDLLFDMSPTAIGTCVLVIGVGVSEIAARAATRRRAEFNEVARTNLTTIEAAMLALIGLLLAFSLSMAVTRFDHRRELMVEEVNAIGTSWLRSGLFAEPTRSRLRAELRAYASSRVDLFEQHRYSAVPESAKGQELRERIWGQASVLAIDDPHSIQAGLLIQSINQMIDLHTHRDVANNNHVPDLVWWLLIMVTLLTMTAVGFNSGLALHSSLPARIGLTLALSATLALTLDLDRPRRGWITISQSPMRELYDSLTTTPRAPPQ